MKRSPHLLKIESKEDLMDLLLDILNHFSHKQCPYCSANISVDEYISQDDIKEWIKNYKEVKE